MGNQDKIKEAIDDIIANAIKYQKDNGMGIVETKEYAHSRLAEWLEDNPEIVVSDNMIEFLRGSMGMILQRGV